MPIPKEAVNFGIEGFIELDCDDKVSGFGKTRSDFLVLCICQSSSHIKK